MLRLVPLMTAAELSASDILAAAAGDRSARLVFVRTYERRVHALLSRVLAGAADVDDVAQETFLRAFGALPRFDVNGHARPSTWLLTIATRAALDVLRKRGTDPMHAAATLPDHLPSAATNDALAAAELRRTVERAAAALAPGIRAAFVLRVFHDLPYEEIAATLDVDVGTVKSRIARAREHMRAALRESHHVH